MELTFLLWGFVTAELAHLENWKSLYCSSIILSCPQSHGWPSFLQNQTITAMLYLGGTKCLGGSWEHFVVQAWQYLPSSNDWSFPLFPQMFWWFCPHPELLQAYRKKHGIHLQIYQICHPMTFLCMCVWVDYLKGKVYRQVQMISKIKQYISAVSEHSGCNINTGFCKLCSQTTPSCCCKCWIYWKYYYLVFTDIFVSCS